MHSHLTERDQQLLSAIIEIYTKTAEPVSSSQISLYRGFECSTATIRNMMMRLEEKGYLSHPYTSAGKLPTYKAYQFFIRQLLLRKSLNNDEEQQIRLQLVNSICEAEQLLRLSAHILAATSELMAVAWIASLEKARLLRVKLIKLNQRRLLLIAYLDNGEVYHQPFEADTIVNEKILQQVMMIVNQRGKGLLAYDLKKVAEEQWEGLDRDLHKLLRQAFLLLGEGLEKHKLQENIIVEGASNLISQPEFDNIMAVRKAMSAIEEKSMLIQSFLEPGIQKGNVTISLEHDKPHQVVPALSVISNQITLRDGRSARLAIVGPRRMAYNRLISVMDYTAMTLSSLAI